MGNDHDAPIPQDGSETIRGAPAASNTNLPPLPDGQPPQFPKRAEELARTNGNESDLATATPQREIRTGLAILGMAALGAGIAVMVVALTSYACSHTDGGSFCMMVENNPPWLLVSGIAAAPAILLTWYWRTKHKEADLAHAKEAHELGQRAQITSRFVAAVQMLEKGGMPAVGGIYALEQIARDAPDEHWTIIQTLAALLREHQKHVVAQAAVTVIGRRDASKDPPWGKISLRGAYLSNIDFCRLNFARADFVGATVADCRFHGADLSGSILNVRNMAGDHAAAYDDDTKFGEGLPGWFNKVMFRENGARHLREQFWGENKAKAKEDGGENGS